MNESVHAPLMPPTRREFLVASGAAVAVAGCLGDDDPDLSGDVNRLAHGDIGDILVGPEGLTLYLFDLDTQHEASSTCYDDCAASWPPLTVDEDPTTGAGVNIDLDTFVREDGDTQVMANGWPLYYFAGDSELGDIAGQGVEDVWWVLDENGTRTVMTPDTRSGPSNGGPY